MKNASRYAIYSAIAIVAAVALGFVVITNTTDNLPPSTDIPLTVAPVIESTNDLKKFDSPDELRKFLVDAQTSFALQYPGSMMFEDVIARPMITESGREGEPVLTEKASAGEGGSTYSTTNVQVSNVDEPDFLKNDGKYVYIVSEDKLTIIEAYPPESAKMILKIGLDVSGQYLQNMFLNKDRLVIFYTGAGERYSIQQYDFIPRPIYMPTTHALIMDVSDKENPKIVKDYEVNGNYYNARMIGNYVYFIANNAVDYRDPILPVLKESSRIVMMPDVYYFDNPEQYYNFNTVTSFDIFGDSINSQTFMVGYTNTLYVSDDNIYLTYQKNFPYYYYETHGKDRFFKIIVPLLPDDVQAKIKSIENSGMNPDEKWTQTSDLLQNTYNTMSEDEKTKLFDTIQKALEEYETRIQQDTRKTAIHKIAIDGGTLKYVSKGEVPGYLLNQFSMDESENRFRIATTSEFYTPQKTVTYNNVYVLDETLNIVGSLEKIAPDESIYSARFMGDKLYLVTFQRIDPFFVIDLSEDVPKVLGALKIPGYSSYLHPYDENHIIGIGKETKESKWGGVETLGVKIALFDVSNVQSPKEVDVFTIGSTGTDSEILWEHKAFLFDKEKNVLSIPIWEQEQYNEPIPLEGEIIRPYPQPKIWRGFYVFGVNANDGISLKGKVEHSTDPNYYGYSYGSRSFYIDDALYTVTSGLMKINDLSDISHEINQVKFGNTGEIIKYIK